MIPAHLTAPYGPQELDNAISAYWRNRPKAAPADTDDDSEEAA